MSDRRVIDLFVEDRAHEEFLGALIARMAREEGGEVEIRVRAARGGHARALDELRVYQDAVLDTNLGLTMPDVVVVAIDGNCRTPNAARRAVAATLRDEFKGLVVAACPDPHVERWFLCEADSFARVVGARPRVGRRKCERGHYKRILADAVSAGGHPVTLGGIEFAREIVEAMDLYRAGKSDASLKHFLDAMAARLA